MKPSPLVVLGGALLLSLSANAMLWLRAAHAAYPASTGPATHASGAAGETGTGVASAKGGGDAKTAASPAAATGTAAFDPVSIKARLEALGLPADAVRAMVAAMIYQTQGARLRELQRRQWDVSGSNDYWRGGRPWENSRLSPDERKEMRDLQNQMNDTLRGLFGADMAQIWGAPDRFAWAPEDKRAKLAAIEEDYGELQQELQQDMSGFSTAGDQRRMALLDEEKRRDLAAVLSPDELAEYDKRFSQTANQMRWKYSDVFTSEEEYTHVYDIQKAFDDKWIAASRSGKLTDEQNKQRQADQEQLEQQIKAAIGDDRYAALQRSQDRDYQQLRAAQRRFDLPQADVDSIYDLKAAVAEESKRIASSSDSYDDRKQQLADLADATRQQVHKTLGDEIADAYLNNSMRWLDQVSRGNTVSFTSNGGWSLSGLTADKQAAGSTPPKP